MEAKQSAPAAAEFVAPAPASAPATLAPAAAPAPVPATAAPALASVPPVLALPPGTQLVRVTEEKKSGLADIEAQERAIVEAAERKANPVRNPVMDALVLAKDNTIKITPETPLCKAEPLLARVAHVLFDSPNQDIQQAYWLEFFSQDLCLNLIDKATNTPIGYWLMKYKPDRDGLVRWALRGAPYNNIMQLYKSEEIPVSIVEKVEIVEAPADPRRSMLNGYRERMSGMVGWNDPDLVKPDLRLIRTRDPNSGRVKTKVQLSTGETYYIDKENVERIRLQNEILSKRKPELVRSLPGAAFAGMGIRTPPESEYRREWSSLKQGDHIAVQVSVTKPNGDLITTTVLVAKITARVQKSPLINALGTVYALEVVSAKGNEDDVFAFTPLRIGRRKIRYWLCVYDDLYDTKIIATSDAVHHDELVQNLKVGDGTLRLAEYAVDDIKLSNEYGDVVSYPGDEDGPGAGTAMTPPVVEKKKTTKETDDREKMKEAMKRELDDGDSSSSEGSSMYREKIKRVVERIPPLKRIRLNAVKRGVMNGE